MNIINKVKTYLATRKADKAHKKEVEVALSKYLKAEAKIEEAKSVYLQLENPTHTEKANMRKLLPRNDFNNLEHTRILGRI